MPHPAAPVGRPTTGYPAVKAVEPADNFRLVLIFDTGERRVFDVTPLLSVGRFRELADRSEFRKVKVAYDTVGWENGLDLDPEYLYEHSTPA